MKRRKWKTWQVVAAGVVVVLIIFRLMLPGMVLRYANKTLAEMDGYYGHVDAIQIALYRGAYQLDGFYLNKVDSASGEQTEFLAAQRIDLSVEWKALFQGGLVGELVVESPTLIFTKDKAEIDEVAQDTTDFRALLKDFMPLRVNRFEIFNGSIRYQDSTSSPIVDLALEETYVRSEER